MYKVWIALGLEGLRECLQTADWLPERLPYVKRLVFSLK